MTVAKDGMGSWGRGCPLEALVDVGDHNL